MEVIFVIFDTTYLAIDLDVIDENFAAVRQKCHSKILTIVKADAYGYGAVPMAKYLESRSDFFGVAYMSEAMELRRAGIQIPILILGHTPRSAYPELIRQKIRPAIFRLDDARALSEEAVRQGVITPIHFAIDTGMSRIGFQADEEGADLCAQVAKLPGLHIEGLFSHYATADEADLRRAEAQGKRLDAFLELLKERKVEIPIVHMSNSAALMNFSKQYNMVRAGVVIHGIYPSSDTEPAKLPIRPALSWHSRITLLKTLPAGREIGYGGTYTTTKTTKVATVPVGYADGYRRQLSGNFYVLIRGKRAPILGRVCMDQMLVDVTDIPDIDINDKVVLVGRSGDEVITMEQIAEAAGSFNYEFVCGISRRVPRIYTQGGKTVHSVHYLLDPFSKDI
jgi:alanine racemase